MSTELQARTRFWGNGWRLVASNQLLIVWLGILAAGGLASLWLPQAARGILQQANGVEAWLPTVRQQLGSATDLLYRLGMLTVSRAAWFRMALAGLAISLLTRSFDTIRILRQPPADFAVSSRLQAATETDPAVALDRIGAALRPTFCRHRTASDSDAPEVLTATLQIAHWPRLVALIAGLLLIAAWLWTESLGWELDGIRLVAGSPLSISRAEAEVVLDNLEVTWGPASQPTMATGTIQILQAGAEVSGAISLDAPESWNGVTYELTSAGPALTVTGAAPDGTPLQFQTAANQPPTSTLIMPLAAADGLSSFALPQEGIIMQVSVEPADGAPGIRLRAYEGRAGELVEDRVIQDSAEITINESRLAFDVAPYAVLRARYLPGRQVLYVAGLITLAALLASLALPPQHLRVAAATAGEQTRLVVESGPSTRSDWAEQILREAGLEPEGEKADE